MARSLQTDYATIQLTLTLYLVMVAVVLAFPDIVLREMLVHEGDTVEQRALYDRMERSRQNLMNTGLFNTVAVVPIYLDQRHAMVEVTVSERWTIWPSPIFQLADPNFNTWWRAFGRDPAPEGIFRGDQVDAALSAWRTQADAPADRAESCKTPTTPRPR